MITLNEADLFQNIEKIRHDFSTTQPMEGVGAYFSHHAFGKWADDKAVEILEQVTTAMKPGDLKIVIHVLILPDIGANQCPTQFDIVTLYLTVGWEGARHRVTDCGARLAWR